MSTAPLGILGGSGLGRLAGFELEEERQLDTGFGSPSAPLRRGRLAGTPVVFVPRHGDGHHLTPSEVPYRANLLALKQLGVERVLSVSAVGSLREDLAPGDFVLVDQFIDRTVARPRSFFGEGCVAHVPFGDPVDAAMIEVLQRCGETIEGLRVVSGGTYLTMEGPQFSSRAESELYRSWGCAVIGMTNGTEARLAREAGLAFASIAMVTDYDCWHPGHDEVDVAQVIAVVQRNAQLVAQLLAAAVADLAALGPSPWRGIAARSLLTRADAIPVATRARLAPLLDEPA
ncbi:MAG: S-methyl-5'-thioadenosine phosphorylase [Planctomycetes bacterium]|nr:S-methyl-5'-thioadenosine phosphorylase [Planctomycetota bacterium]